MCDKLVLRYYYITAEYFIENGIFTYEEACERKFVGEGVNPRPFVGILITNLEKPIWIPQQTIHTDWEKANVNNKNIMFYSFKCDEEKEVKRYLSIKDLVVCPKEICAMKWQHNTDDIAHLQEIEDNLDLIGKKINICIRHHIAKKVGTMVDVFTKTEKEIEEGKF